MRIMINRGNNSHRFLVFSLLIVCLFSSCQSGSVKQAKKNGFSLEGTLKGLKEGKLIASLDYGIKILDTLDVKGGKFYMTGDFPIAKEVLLQQLDGEWESPFYAENSKMTFYGDVNSFDIKVSGGKFQEGRDKYFVELTKFMETHEDPSYLEADLEDPEIPADQKKIIEEKFQKATLAFKNFNKNFVAQNPSSVYSAHIIYERLVTKVGGESAESLKTWIDLLDKSIYENPFVAMMLNQFHTMIETEASLGAFVALAPDVTYKVDKSYKGSLHENISYMSIFNDNKLCALFGTTNLHKMLGATLEELKEKKNFFIKIINDNGTELNRFKVEGEGIPTCLAVNDSDEIFVLFTIRKEVEQKIRGRLSKFIKNIAVVCQVYNQKGKMLKTFNLEGLRESSGARIYRDKLLVSSCGQSSLAIYNMNDGNKVSTIEDLRPCCSILDFDVDKKGQIMVANLGSFRVDGYNIQGQKIVSFGQRGKGVNDFSGCCNPVSVRKLDNNCIITVEKTPTRIKVYSKSGAHKIEGVDELVNGCYHIPVISDTDNNIYLASPDKGIIKCVLVN